MSAQPDNNQRNFIGLTAVILLIITAFILLVDWNHVFRILEGVAYGLLLAASAALIIGLFFFALRWRLLMANKPTMALTFHASNIGFAGNILIPFRGGEALRIFVMGRSGQVSYTTATASFVVERLFEQLLRLLALITAVVIGVGIKITPLTLLSGLGFIVLLAAAIYWLITHQQTIARKAPAHLARLPRISQAAAQQWLSDLFANLQNIAKPQQFVLTLLYSLLSWLFSGCSSCWLSSPWAIPSPQKRGCPFPWAR